jgi:hypothetical protein
MYYVLSSFFINLYPPQKDEILGKYTSTYDDKIYILDIDKNGTCNFVVKENNIIIYSENCTSHEVASQKYRTFTEYSIYFNKCEKMNSSAILKRDYLFNLLIGNNGTELKRIDPDSNIFYKKIKSSKKDTHT